MVLRVHPRILQAYPGRGAPHQHPRYQVTQVDRRQTQERPHPRNDALLYGPQLVPGLRQRPSPPLLANPPHLHEPSLRPPHHHLAPINRKGQSSFVMPALFRSSALSGSSRISSTHPSITSLIFGLSYFIAARELTPCCPYTPHS